MSVNAKRTTCFLCCADSCSSPSLSFKLPSLAVLGAWEQSDLFVLSRIFSFPTCSAASKPSQCCERLLTVLQANHHSAASDSSQCCKQTITVLRATPHSAASDSSQCCKRLLTVLRLTPHSAASDSSQCCD